MDIYYIFIYMDIYADIAIYILIFMYAAVLFKKITGKRKWKPRINQEFFKKMLPVLKEMIIRLKSVDGETRITKGLLYFIHAYDGLGVQTKIVPPQDTAPQNPHQTRTSWQNRIYI
jgi:hypothetical protein